MNRKIKRSISSLGHSPTEQEFTLSDFSFKALSEAGFEPGNIKRITVQTTQGVKITYKEVK